MWAWKNVVRVSKIESDQPVIEEYDEIYLDVSVAFIREKSRNDQASVIDVVDDMYHVNDEKRA